MFSPRGGPQPLPAAPTAVPPAPFSAPLVTPMVALVLPNYLFPNPSSYPYGVAQAPAEGPPTPASHSPAPSLPPLPPSPPHRPDSPLFNSRCSSPLQLNLLQLEEPPRVEAGAGAGGPGSSAGPPAPSQEAAEPEARLVSTAPPPPAPHALLPPSLCPSCAFLPASPGTGVPGMETPAEFLRQEPASSVKWAQSCLVRTCQYLLRAHLPLGKAPASRPSCPPALSSLSLTPLPWRGQRPLGSGVPPSSGSS